MRHVRSSWMLAAILCAACADNPAAPPASVDESSRQISDALHGPAGNPHFFWLPPMTRQPAPKLFGRFERLASPQVRVVCASSNHPFLDCDGATPVVPVVDRTHGLQVAEGQFKVNLDTHGAGLVVTSDPVEDYTTYRIQVFTEDMPELGGPFLLGYADIQIAATGKQAKNLTTDDVIGLVDGSTLPVRFRIDAGAYEYALNVAGAVGAGDPEDQPICQTNCSITFVLPDQTTEASLSDADGREMTAMQFEPGDVSVPSVLVIDERITEGDDTNCAVGVTLDKKHCYRYRITPDVEFNNPVRFGICPYDVPLDISDGWRILKVDYDLYERPILTRPDPVDVSDFLPCTMPSASSSMIAEAVHSVGDWLVPPLLAATPRVWGGMARDLSDLFWGLDAEMAAVGQTYYPPVPVDTTLSATVQIVKLLPDPDEPLEGAEVTFRIPPLSSGALSLPEGGDLVSSETTDGRVTSMTVRTGSGGYASVDWTIGEGADTILVTSPSAVTVNYSPIVFTAQGVAPPHIDAVDPASIVVPESTPADGTFTITGTGFTGGEMYTSAPLLLTGTSTVDGDGTSISRTYEIGVGASPGSYRMYVVTPFGTDSIPIELTAPWASTGWVRGTVTLCGSEPLAYANLTLVGTLLGALTNQSGQFVFASVPPGTYSLTATYPGYEGASTDVTVVAGGTVIANLDICTTIGEPPPAE